MLFLEDLDVIGKTISHYKILEKLGEGGMGVVFKAEDLKLKRMVAVKFLPKRLSVHGEERERFVHEAQAASALNHPNICVIHEIDEVNDESFIVMEYMDGVTLREWIRKKAEQSGGYRRLGVKESVDLATQIAEGLQKAHEKGIIHRDVKSENIMVTTDGRAKIMDFGLAKLKGVSKLTKTGSTVGTVAYMSPEQVEGIETDLRTDIFSFGVVMYEMLSGRLPFRAEHETAMMYEIINVEPHSLIDQHKGIEPELNHIVMKCLEKDREERYQSMREVAVDLKRYKRDSEGRRVDRKSDAGEAPSTLDPAPAPAHAETRWLKIGVASLGAIVLIALGVYLFFPKATSIDSIAVLPLSNVTSDSSSEYLCDGFTESLINSLSKLPGVKLMSRSSVFRFKGKDIDPQKAGKELGVGAVLTGRLTQRGDGLMVSVELVDVKDNSHIWGDQYERKLSDILTLQSDISKEISNQLKITLTGDQQRALLEHPTENAGAYKLYLQGLFYWNKRTREGFEKAISYYQQAISIDPSYALAYAGLANVYALQGSYFIISTKEARENAHAMALKALQLDERLAEAHTVLAALAENYEWKWEDAEREYKRAIELNPNYATAHQWYAEFLCAMRRFDEGSAQHKRAIEIDPLSPVVYLSAAFDLVAQKQYEEATKMVVKCMEIDPAFPRSMMIRGEISFFMGKPQEALKDLRAVVALSDSSDEYLAYLGNMLGLMGNRAEATTLLHTLLDRQQSRYVDPSLIVIVYIGLGEKDQAFHWLDKAYEAHSNSVEYLLIDPSYDPIRSDPRFAALVKKIGLPQ